MRKKLQKYNIPQPNFKLCKNREEIKNAIKKIGIPCVLKPVGGHSSFGTFMARDEKNLKEVMEKYDECCDYLLSQSKKDLKQMAGFTKEELATMGITDDINTITDYLVEEFMSGKEISVDALVQDGKVNIIGVALQVRMDPPYFVQVSETMPYFCSKKQMSEIKSLIENTIKAIGIRNSATHTEIIITESGMKIVEIACRIGSDNIHDAVYQTSGYSLVYELVKILLGEKRKFDVKTIGHYAMEYILPKKEGLLKDVIIPQGIKNDSDVTEYRIDVKSGDFIAHPPENFDFIGYVGVCGDTPEQAQKKLKQAIDAIEVVYE